MSNRLSPITSTSVASIATATLRVDTRGAGFHDITADAHDFISGCRAKNGALLVFLRHTSASLTIQENADPDVQTDLMTALESVAPEGAPWIHDAEGPDDMPAHVKAMLNGISLHVPVNGGRLSLGIWQGLYLIEHRRKPHARDIIFQFIGALS